MEKKTSRNRSNLLSLPDFNLDQSEMPDVRLKSIRFQNFKVFDDTTFHFMDGKIIKPFVCFSGNNGSGKSTILECIQLIFSRFEGREKDDLKVLLGKSVRHKDRNQNGIYGEDDFLITADIHSSFGDYQVQLNKHGFIKDHPPKIKMLVYRLCFSARFDMELHQFQLSRNKWKIFKKLFENVTGFKIEERRDIFDSSEDPIQSNMMKEYVLGFWVHKPDETISHKECSAGERKIIKCFSTLLSKEYIPSIICIDNVEMHVETGRHINLVESVKKCFPCSQIFCTTHSYQISKNFGDKNQLYDLRIIKASKLVKNEPWRIYISDEIKDAISKLKSATSNQKMAKFKIKEGEGLIKRCFSDKNSTTLIENCDTFLSLIPSLYIKDLVSFFN